jgi:hypothetical protein
MSFKSKEFFYQQYTNVPAVVARDFYSNKPFATLLGKLNFITKLTEHEKEHLI